MATRDLTPEERGVYNDILELLYEKNRRLPDDPRNIAGFVGVSVRRWKQIREGLIEAGKLVVFGDYLSNPEFETVRLQTEEASERFSKLGHIGGKKRARNAARLREEAAKAKQAKLPLNEENLGNPPVEPKPPLETAADDDKNHESDVFADFLAVKKRAKSDVSQSENGSFPPPDPKPARVTRFARKKLRDIDTTPTLESYDPRELTERLCEAASVSVLKEATLGRELGIVEKWTKAGFDIEGTVLPTIARQLERMGEDETVGSLAYFDAAIRKAHNLKGKSPAPTATPAKTERVKATDLGDVGPIREALRHSLGAKTFNSWFAPTALQLNGSSLTVVAPSRFFADWVSNHFRRDLERASGVEVRIVTE